MKNSSFGTATIGGMRLSLLTLSAFWLINLTGALFCYVLAEVYQGFFPAFPLLFVVVLGCQLQGICAVVTIFIGRQLYGTVFEAYQPFQGGAKFICLQFLGILNVLVSIIASLVYLLLFDVHRQYRGAFLALEVVAFVGNIVILVSLRFYVPEGDAAWSMDGHPLNYRILRRSPNSQTAVVVALMLSQCAFAEIPHHVPSLRSSCSLLCLAIHVVNGIVIHFVIGCRHTPGYSPFMLRLPHPGDTFLYWLKWGYYWVSLLFLSFIGVQYSSHLQDGGWLSVAVSFSLFTTTTVLLHVRTGTFTPRPTPKVSLRVSLTSSLIVTITVIILAFMSYVLLLVMRRRVGGRRVDMSAAVGFRNASGLPLDMATEAIRSEKVMVILFLVGHCVVLLAAPLCVIVGRMVYGDDFNCFQQSKFSFVFLHATAGGLYTTAVFSFLHFLVTRYLQLSIVAGGTALLSAVLVLHSFRLYVPVAKSRLGYSSPPPGSFSGAELTSEGHRSVLFLNFLNGEVVVGFIMWLSGFILRLLVNVIRAELWGPVQVPVGHMILLANIFFIIAVPLVHASARNRGIRMFHPFSGSGVFVGLQVIGWMLYASLAIFSGTSFFLSVMSRNKVPSSSADVDVLYGAHSDLWRTGWTSTVVGFLEFIPLSLITLSISIESKLAMSLSEERDLALEGMERLVRMTAEAMADRPQEEVERLKLLINTLLAPSLSYYHIEDDVASMLMEEGDGNSATPDFSSPLFFYSSPRESEESSYHLKAMKLSHHQGALAIVILFSFASILFFILASFFCREPTLAIAFEVLGFLWCTLSCGATQAGYGMLLHEKTGEFSVFMPFKGGKEFVYYQTAGWSCYACVFLIAVVCAVDPDQISAVLMSAAAVLSVSSQGLILRSIPAFCVNRSNPDEVNFFEENGEGLVSLLAFTSAYGAQLFLDAMRKVWGSAPADASVTRQNVGFVVTVVSMSIALPCLFVAVGRTSSNWKRRAQKASLEKEAVQLSSTVMSALQLMLVLASSLVPVMVAYVVYALSQSYTPSISWLVEDAGYLGYAIIIVLVALSALHTLLDVGLPSFVVRMQICLVTWCTYGLAALETLAMIVAVTFWPRLSFWLVDFFIAFFTVFGGHKWASTVMKLIFYGALMQLTSSVFQNMKRDWDARSPAATPAPADWKVIAIVLVRWLPGYLFDMGLILFCVKYLRRYVGRPTLTGSLRSEKFIAFAKRHLFSCCSKYVSFQVVVDDDSVDLRNPKNKYLFSFHPHGVFPGTALYAPFTDQWIEKLGCNSETHITTHVASVVLNVPLVRDFNLMLGSLSVSRKGIECNFAKGNSAIIVTGGQAEMLHSCISETELTLVAYHTGFIRIAIANKVPLVPLLCFGEQNLMGIMQFPTIQKATLPLLGFPFPMAPYGRFGLPIPYAAKLVLVVGRRLDIPPEADPDDADAVESLRVAYFNALHDLFYRHREEAGFPHMELRLIHTSPKQAKQAKREDKKSK